MHHAVNHGAGARPRIAIALGTQRRLLVHPGKELGVKDLHEWGAVQDIVALQPVRERDPRLVHIAPELAQHRDRGEPGERSNWVQGRTPEPAREMAVNLEELLIGVAGVAAEDFVPSFSGQQPGGAFATREAGAQIGRDYGCVGEGLVAMGCNPRNRIRHVLGVDTELAGIGVEVAGGDAGVFDFVRALVLKTRGIGADRGTPQQSQVTGHG